MSNLKSERLLRVGAKGEKEIIRLSFAVYDRTTNKPKLVAKGFETKKEADDCASTYIKTHLQSFCVVVKEATEMEVVTVT